jgi:predicted transcriptional regulator
MEDTQKTDVKASAREAIELLPENSTWDDVIYRMYVRQKIDAGLADVDAGKVVDTAELRRRLGLRP